MNTAITNIEHETEDLALLFIEEEVGRFDWRKNWPAIQAAGLGLERVTNWLRTIKVEHDPREIVAFLDQMVRDRSGRWL